MYKSIEEATAARLDTQDRIMSIEVQLSERKAKMSVGQVPNDEYREYLEWKSRACRAKRTLVGKLARIKLELFELRKQGAAQRVINRGGEEALLNDLYQLAKSLVGAGADISADEQQLLDDVAARLNR